ncbi:MAG: hypothetical protein ACR2FG_05830 [Marmoricola sp.]
MSLDLAPLEGAFRTRLDEAEWTAVWTDSISTGTRSQVAPLPLEPDVEVPDAEVPAATREAVTVATGSTAVVTLELASITPSRGILADLGTDGKVAAGVVRALVVPDPAGAVSADDVVLAPGVELSAFALDQLVDEVLRLFPPDGPMSGTQPEEPIRMPAEWAMVLARAVRERDEPMLHRIAAECGWDDVPDLLVSLAEEVRANATVTMRVTGSERVGLRRWLQCHLGWVSLGLGDGFVTHRLCSREQIRADLVYDLTGALDAVLAGASSDGR